jgi:hypothetical protein
MSPLAGGLDARSFQGALNNGRYGQGRNTGPERSDIAKKDAFGRFSGRPAFQIPEQGVANFLGQRQPYFKTPLARDAHRAALPFDIGEPKLGHVTGAQPKPGQQQNNGSVA